jgi:hypothetical protein
VRQKSKNIVAILMAVVMVFSTISLTIHHWYCQGDLVGTTLFTNASCCKVSDCENSYMVTTSCCEHEAVVIQGQNDLQHQEVHKKLLNKQFFVDAYLTSRLHSLETPTKRILSRKLYIPPNIIIDKLSAYQVFII